MELALSPEDAAFRDEVRAFIKDNYPAEMRVPNPETDLSKEQMLLWHRILHEKGWIAPLWPKEYGGPGWSILRPDVVVGDAAQVADRLEQWFVEGAADGFNVMPAFLPGGLEDFVDKVVPVLQRRGLFRRGYQGRTLRDHLGLSRPAHPGFQEERVAHG